MGGPGGNTAVLPVRRRAHTASQATGEHHGGVDQQLAGEGSRPLALGSSGNPRPSRRGRADVAGRCEDIVVAEGQGDCPDESPSTGLVEVLRPSAPVVHVEDGPESQPVGIGDRRVEEQTTDPSSRDLRIDEEAFHDGDLLGRAPEDPEPGVGGVVARHDGPRDLAEDSSVERRHPARSDTVPTEPGGHVEGEVGGIAVGLVDSPEHLDQIADVLVLARAQAHGRINRQTFGQARFAGDAAYGSGRRWGVVSRQQRSRIVDVQWTRAGAPQPSSESSPSDRPRIRFRLGRVAYTGPGHSLVVVSRGGVLVSTLACRSAGR